MNFVLITKEANKAISDDSLDIYAKKITPESKAALNITAYVSEDAAGTRDKIHGILDNRFEMLNGNVLNTINNKLMGWK